MRWNPKKNVSKGKLIILWKSKLIILSLLYVIAIIHQIIKGSGYCFFFLNPVAASWGLLSVVLQCYIKSWCVVFIGVCVKFRKVRGQKLGGDWLAFERVNRLFLMTAQAKAWGLAFDPDLVIGLWWSLILSFGYLDVKRSREHPE